MIAGTVPGCRELCAAMSFPVLVVETPLDRTVLIRGFYGNRGQSRALRFGSRVHTGDSPRAAPSGAGAPLSRGQSPRGLRPLPRQRLRLGGVGLLLAEGVAEALVVPLRGGALAIVGGVTPLGLRVLLEDRVPGGGGEPEPPGLVPRPLEAVEELEVVEVGVHVGPVGDAEGAQVERLRPIQVLDLPEVVPDEPRVVEHPGV